MLWLQSKLKRQKEQQHNLIQVQNKKRHDVFKNRLFLSSILNAIVFLVFVFAMSYYDWSVVTIPTVTSIAYHENSNFTLYANLVYVKFFDQALYSSYSSLYGSCIKDDLLCLACISQLEFIGALSFCLLIIGSLFQIFDIVFMIHYLFILKKQQQRQYQERKQDNLRHILTIFIFLVGITLNLFGMCFSNVKFTYGISFWIFVAGIVCFIIIIIYEQFSLDKYQKQKLILELIENERNVAKCLHQRVEIQLSNSEGEAYI